MPALLDEHVHEEPVDLVTLEALALAADPEQGVEPDAVPWSGLEGDGAELLPSWYMPAPATGARSTWQRVLGWSFVVALLAVNVSGLCVTYGVLELA
jgi:hypothetical protein